MAEARTIGAGTEFKRWDENTSTFVKIARVRNITGPSMSRETADDTTLDNTSGYRDIYGGMRAPGTLTFSMDFTRAGYLAMKADFESDVVQYYQLILADTDSTTLEFAGLVTDLPLNIPDAGEKVACDVTIAISGKVYTDADSDSLGI